MIALLLIGAAFVVSLALKSYDPRRLPTAVLLCLRLASLGLIVALAIDPTVPVPWRVVRDWVVLVDGSASMAIEDSGGVSRAVRGLASLPDAVRRGRVLVMGSTPRAAKPSEVSSSLLDGSSTDLAAMLGRAARMQPGLRRVILISDGRSIGPDPAATARGSGLRVSCIGVDDTGEAPDIAVMDAIAPSTVVSMQPFAIATTIRLSGGRAVQAAIDLDIDGRLVASDTHTIDPDRPIRLDVSCPGLVPGPARVRVAVEPVPGERVLENNTRSVSVLVRAAKWSVLIAADAPSWDVAFLRRSLIKDGGFDVQMKVPGVEPGAEMAVVPDVLVVGQWHASPDPALREMADRTLARGGAVLILGWPHQSVWRGVSPLLTAADRSTTGRLKPRPIAVEHPVVAAWGHGPFAPLTLPDGAISVSGAASVLLETEQGVPMVATQTSGAGQVLTWLGADLWRWQLAETAPENGPWPAIVRWLLSPDTGARLRLHPGKDVYDAGEAISLGVEAFGLGWEPGPEGRVEVAVGAVGSPPVMERRFVLAPGAPMPVVELPGLTAGEWEIRAHAILARGDTLTATRRISVSSTSHEQRLLHPDMETLSRLARTSGGIMVSHRTPATADSLLGAGEYAALQRAHLRRIGACFILLVAFLGLEWWLRTRRGLP